MSPTPAVAAAAFSTIVSPTTTTTTTNSSTSAAAQTKTTAIPPQDFSSFQLAKLKEAGLLGVQRPYTIVAEAIGSSAEMSMRGLPYPLDANEENNPCIASKIIHFQRHGQGYHNLIGEMYRSMSGQPINLDDKDPVTNPFLRKEMTDSPLTEQGRTECTSKRRQAAMLNPQVVIVSPLHRAIQTAMLSFADHYNNVEDEDNNGITWIAHEGVREQLGLLMCNKRRPLEQIQQEFPHIDYSLMESNDDTLWDPQQRELPRDETDRIYNFLTEFLMDRPEDELAVVGHSAWLFTMCNAVVDCGNDDELKSLFQTSEIRSMRLSFYKTPEAQ